MNKIKITWEVEDGYLGRSRPQTTTVDIEKEIMSEEDWNELTEDDKKEILDQAVEEDYKQKISFSITNYGI
jgi:hypothetical protein